MEVRNAWGRSLETLEPNDSVCQWNLKNSGPYFFLFYGNHILLVKFAFQITIKKKKKKTLLLNYL
jgi:hypothetical protein